LVLQRTGFISFICYQTKLRSLTPLFHFSPRKIRADYSLRHCSIAKNFASELSFGILFCVARTFLICLKKANATAQFSFLKKLRSPSVVGISVKTIRYAAYRYRKRNIAKYGLLFKNLTFAIGEKS